MSFLTKKEKITLLSQKTALDIISQSIHVLQTILDFIR